jgi:hypothetical protein
MISTTAGFVDIFFAILAWLCEDCKLIFDVGSFQCRQLDRRPRLLHLLECFVPCLAHSRIVSTAAMRDILALRSLSSFLVRDCPGIQFHPDLSIRESVLESLGLPSECFLVAVPMTIVIGMEGL